MKDLLIFLAWCSTVSLGKKCADSTGFSLAERLPGIKNAIFLSTNFENIFTWELKEEAIPGTVFEVQYQKYGDAWHRKAECQNITRHFCNLTHETENYTEPYHARVRAIVPRCCVSEWVMSPRFYPRHNTLIGSPEVKYFPGIQSIKFFVQPPYTPLRDEDQPLTVADIFSQLGAPPEYEITIFNQRTQQQWMKSESNKEFEIPNLDPDTEYNGTIHIKFFDKTSKPYMFRVRTLADNTWMIYLLWVVLLMMTMIFGTLYCLIYKYVKQHPTQKPASLDFKDTLHFRALTFNKEHVLIPCDFPKPTQLVAVKQAAQISQHLMDTQEDQRPSSQAESMYQQQAKMPSFQAVDQPISQAANLPRQGYAPQVATNPLPWVPDDQPSTVQYGICFEGTKSASSVGNELYKRQKPEQIKRSWGSKTQPLLVQGDTQEVPQRFPVLLEEKVPESSGSYRKQPTELLPALLDVNQAAILQGDLTSTTPTPSLLSPWAHCSFAHQDHPGQPSAWDALAWTDNQERPLEFQAMDYVAHANRGPKSASESFQPHPSALDSVQNNGLFTGFFRDLELKLQWDQGPDGNAVL